MLSIHLKTAIAVCVIFFGVVVISRRTSMASLPGVVYKAQQLAASSDMESQRTARTMLETVSNLHGEQAVSQLLQEPVHSFVARLP